MTPTKDDKEKKDKKRRDKEKDRERRKKKSGLDMGGCNFEYKAQGLEEYQE